jgi:type IV pilus assembly protein PilM
MFNFMSSPNSIGLERTPNGIKGASVAIGRKMPSLLRLFTLHPGKDNVKPLYMHHPVITTGLEGKEVLVRPLHLPLTKTKDIEESLAFQAEPLLPYAADQAFLAYQIVSKMADSTDLTLLAVRKEAIQAHLEPWQALQIEPEKIACVSSALCEFGAAYLTSVKTCLILHLQRQETTCVLIKDGKLWTSFAQPEGLNLLLTAQADEGLACLPQHEGEWQALEQKKESSLAEAFKRLQKEVTKMSYALAKECKSGTIEGIAVTGEAAEWQGLSQALTQQLSLPLLACQPPAGYSSQDLLSYAVPIGLAIGSLPDRTHCIDFRQQEWIYPHPWHRLRAPVVTYFVAILLLSCTFYFFGQQYLYNRENQLKQNYIDLLSGMNKSHEGFELAFAAKNPGAHEPFNGEIPKVEQIHQEDLMMRLAFLQKELQATPDSFPLFANIPRVSDILAWLSQHPAVIFTDEEGKRQAKLQIENFSYTMMKRPQQGKKQEKYQVKVELEFSSPTPKWAREFHDALIAPNDWVDPKGEVKWNTNRGKYKTSFFLKDKTAYPSA